MEVRFKKLNSLAKIPTRGSKFSAGYDLYAATDYDIHIPPHSTVKIGTGLAMDLPYGYFGAIVAIGIAFSQINLESLRGNILSALRRIYCSSS